MDLLTFFLCFHHYWLCVRTPVDLVDGSYSDHVCGVGLKAAQQSFIMYIAFLRQAKNWKISLKLTT